MITLEEAKRIVLTEIKGTKITTVKEAEDEWLILLTLPNGERGGFPVITVDKDDGELGTFHLFIDKDRWRSARLVEKDGKPV